MNYNYDNAGFYLQVQTIIFSNTIRGGESDRKRDVCVTDTTMTCPQCSQAAYLTPLYQHTLLHSAAKFKNSNKTFLFNILKAD